MPLFGRENVSELTRFYREMLPAPGRVGNALRFALSAALAVLFLLILQAPTSTFTLTLFALVMLSHDTPYDCFKDGITVLVFAAMAAASALVPIIVTGNDPVWRVLGIASFTFIATFIYRTSNFPIGGIPFGIVAYMGTSIWERRMPAERLLHLALWPLGALAVGVGCVVAVDYLFNQSDPARALRQEIGARLRAMEQLLHLHRAKADVEQIGKQIVLVRRYAVTGVGRLNVLLERVAKSQARSGDLDHDRFSELVPVLTLLLDLAAACTFHNAFETAEPKRLDRLCRALTAVCEGQLEQVQPILGDSPRRLADPLDRFEQTLHGIGFMLEPDSKEQLPVARPDVPEKAHRKFFVPDAFTNFAYIAYSLKLSLCGAICYVIYNGLGWPGIRTSYITVLVAGLSTTGATNRKLVFRLIGSTIGGVILGLGCLIFVFPNIEGVTAFLLVIALVSFIGAWVLASPYFGYIGVQIMVAFFLLAFESYSAPTQMTPARDRLLGILLGLVVMLLIFHQIRPERSIDAMRRTLAGLLRAQAGLSRLASFEPHGTAPSPKMLEIRHQIARLVAALHSYSDVVKYEYEPDRTEDIAISDEILDAASCSAELLFGLNAWPEEAGPDALNTKRREFREMVQTVLRTLASSLEQPSESPQESLLKLREDSQELLDALRGAEAVFLEKAVASCRQLQIVCGAIIRSAA